jgi:GNAT superfamily N-acetyltransferase
MADVRRLGADDARLRADALADILIDAVEGGASVGFQRPLDRELALNYWYGVASAVEARRAILLVAGDPALGTVQLHFPAYPNGRHRAEVAKLLVRREARRRGVGQLLMQEVEHQAMAAGRRLLFLDTQTGSDAERLYCRLGWKRAGVIPDFAYAPDGQLWPSTFLFKRLGDAD